MHCFNSIFGINLLSCCPLYCQSPDVIILCILLAQSETLCTHMVLQAEPHPLTLTTVPGGLEEEDIHAWCSLWMKVTQQDLESLYLSLYEAIDVHSGEWCLSLVLCTQSGACQKWMNEWMTDVLPVTQSSASEHWRHIYTMFLNIVQYYLTDFAD